MTKIIKTTDPNALAKAVYYLRRGAVIAIPTDTIYGVAALAHNAQAVAAIFQVKDRPSEKQLPVFIQSIADLDQVCGHVSTEVKTILAEYWPGALTAVLPVSANLPTIVVNNSDTVGVRIPNHPVVAQLLALLKQPLAVTSANLSGRPNTQTARAIMAQLGGRIPLILDDGPTKSEAASTVVDFTQVPPTVLRQGALQVIEATSS